MLSLPAILPLCGCPRINRSAKEQCSLYTKVNVEDAYFMETALCGAHHVPEKAAKEARACCPSQQSCCSPFEGVLLPDY